MIRLVGVSNKTLGRKDIGLWGMANVRPKKKHIHARTSLNGPAMGPEITDKTDNRYASTHFKHCLE
jgi:hypothetical protein